MAGLANKHELLQQRRRDMQERNAALAQSPTEVLDVPPRLSTAARTLQQALPTELIQQGVITYDARNQPKIATYDPTLLAPNPQRGRIVDHHLDGLAASLDEHGQQEPILARLITDLDRQRWPEHFRSTQRLLILKGHRLYFAQPRTQHVTKLRVELLLPEEGESELNYSRRAFARAALKMMHSQEYTVFDKVNLYRHWIDEFALGNPSDAQAAAHFEISKAQAVRLRIIAQLDETIAQEMINEGRLPADEVIYEIAKRPPPEQRRAYEEFATLTVQGLRKRLQREEEAKPDTKVEGRGRPRNFTFAFKDEATPFTFIGTARSAREWQEKGGATAFLNALRKMTYHPEVQKQLKRELG